MRTRTKVASTLTLVFLFSFALLVPVSVLGATKISPDNPTMIVSIPTQFTLTGLTASTDFGVNC